MSTIKRLISKTKTVTKFRRNGRAKYFAKQVYYLLLLMLELLCEAVSLALQSLRLTLVHGGLAHARTLAIGISVVH